MTRVVWDDVGARRYEGGCDRAVLYLPEGYGVPWNGLTSVTETSSDAAVEEYYLDGVKYLNRRTPTDYSGSLKALTYPDEFLPFDGTTEFFDGISASNQPVNDTFGLCYRTKIGNDTDGLDFGYKLHLLYNLTAIPDTKTFDTFGSTTTPEEFSWTLSGIPIKIDGLRPTVKLTIDSTRVQDNAMFLFESYLYGSDSALPMLPDPATLIGLHYDIITALITEPI